ncbi:ATP-grasp domain-containing protein [bacterium]|nr:ATP-grasp domain-containing protein [bacterium]
MRRQERILVLYNRPSDELLKTAPESADESEAGVWDEMLAVTASLNQLGIDYRVGGAASLADMPRVLGKYRERVIFNLVEGFYGSPAADPFLVPAVCEAFDREYTGNTTPCQLLANNKWQTNALLRAAGIPCPASIMVPEGGKVPAALPFAGPCIVKPACTDASEGIEPGSVIRKPTRAAVQRVADSVSRRFSQPAIVEQFIDGRELNIALLEDGDDVRTMPVAEVEFRGYDASRPKIIDYAAKWLRDSFEYQNTVRVVPAPLPRSLADRVRRIALAAWSVVGCRDYARVDLRLNKKGEPFVLEVNPNPDISLDAGFSAALAAADIEYADFVKAVVGNARRRLRRTHQP